jgi:hypothetical protein
MVTNAIFLKAPRGLTGLLTYYLFVCLLGATLAIQTYIFRHQMDAVLMLSITL